MNDMKNSFKPVYLLTLTILVALAGSSMTLNRTNSSTIRSAENLTSSDWLSLARTAWSYYQPNVGVNSATGLHKATLAWHCFTDWDLGTYVYAVIFARELGLITDIGTWQFNDRVAKVLSFLQNRPLGEDNTPYLAYDWATGQACSDTGTALSGPADAGRLLTALHALKTYKPSCASAVDAVFQTSRSAYDTFATQLGGDYYSYLVAEGYAGFGYDTSRTFNALDNYGRSYVQVYGQDLPAVQTLAEPLIHEVLESDWMIHQPGTTFLDFAKRVYLAQSGRYSATGNLTGWSEGGYTGNPAPYIYEWIIYPSKTSRQWFIGDALMTATYNIGPLAYTKVAFAYLAIYGESKYTTALANAAMNLATSQGFGEATFENGQSAISLYDNTNGFYSDKTNEFILAAADHAMQSLPPPTPLTMPTASNTSTSISASTQRSSSANQSGFTISEGLPLVTIVIVVACVLLLVKRFRSRRSDVKPGSSGRGS